MNDQHPPSQLASPLPPPLPPNPGGHPAPMYVAPPPPADVSKAFPVQAAKFSLYAALFAFFINYFAVQGGRGMPAVGHLAVALLCGVMILVGFILGIVALVKNRDAKLRGVRGYAIAGIAINGLFLLLNVILFGRLLLS